MLKAGVSMTRIAPRIMGNDKDAMLKAVTQRADVADRVANSFHVASRSAAPVTGKLTTRRVLPRSWSAPDMGHGFADILRWVAECAHVPACVGLTLGAVCWC